MIDVPALFGFLQYFITPFALFAIPLLILGAVGVFFIIKDYQLATDTSSPEDHLAAALQHHEQALASVEDQHRIALEHAQHQREQQYRAVQLQTLAALQDQMKTYYQAGMGRDLRAVCEAALAIDPDCEPAQRYLQALQAAQVAAASPAT